MGSCLPQEVNSFDHLVKKHPCFNGEAHNRFGRIHLPVSPACNIQCRFCKRGFNKWEKRPGVSQGILDPGGALKIVERALELCPQITVAGIAGPGDTLATDHALDTFQIINKHFPHLINCLSTNGLLLEEKAERIVESGVKTVTVTVNAVTPEILNKICSHIIYKNQYLVGEEAAAFLINTQLRGIEKLSRLGAVVKINNVLIPGINDTHTEEVARLTSQAGAGIINIIPLIPQHEMANINPPDCNQLNQAREAAEKYLTVFRHCRQCRADACGIPGADRDFAELLYDSPQPTFSHG